MGPRRLRVLLLEPMAHLRLLFFSFQRSKTIRSLPMHISNWTFLPSRFFLLALVVRPRSLPLMHFQFFPNHFSPMVHWRAMRYCHSGDCLNFLYPVFVVRVSFSLSLICLYIKPCLRLKLSLSYTFMDLANTIEGSISPVCTCLVIQETLSPADHLSAQGLLPDT